MRIGLSPAWLLYLLTVAFTCAGQVLQKIAATKWEQGAGELVGLIRLPTFWAGGFCLAAAACSWLLLLRDWEVGRAYAMLSVNYIVMLILARLFFREVVLTRHWIGSAFIVAGIGLLGAG